MKIAIIGAGISGMTAAFDLQQAGHEVDIYESSNFVGGLASGFKEPQWNWSLEHYYHHWFTGDSDILGLIEELGLRDRVIFSRPKTVVYHNGSFFPLDSPLAALTFPGFRFIDMVRFGLVTVYLRYLSSWQKLEKYTAEEWMRKWYGENVYRTTYEPLLMGKFGPYYKKVNMAWMWARLKVRSTQLGTFQGGFQAFCDTFASTLHLQGVNIKLNTPVQKISPNANNGIQIETENEILNYDQCLVTTSPQLLSRIAPGLPDDYLKSFLELKHLGAVVLVLALRRRLSQEGYYWFNLPKTAGYPFLALVEHTNFVSPKNFGWDHIVYCGDYLEPDHEYFDLSKDELLKLFLPSLARFNKQFNKEWIRSSWLFKTKYAQPVPLLNHSKNIPEIRTPIQGLYFACMSQVYPWDRGTNFAVRIARDAARLMLEDQNN